MPVDKHTAKVIRSFGQDNNMNSVPMDSDSRVSQCAQQGQSKAQASRPGRLMHQSTLTLGDMTSASCYTTTHTQSYSGRAANGQPLIFHLRDPSFPSQHLNQLDLSNTTPCQLQSHTKEVHGPKDIPPRADMKLENWVQYRGGQAVREITNPKDPTPYWTTNGTDHRHPVTACSPHRASGRPAQWHQHNILTGEQRQPAGPRKPSRPSGDRMLWATRRWEADCCALRLY